MKTKVKNSEVQKALQPTQKTKKLRDTSYITTETAFKRQT
jgi:hypothetical protein